MSENLPPIRQMYETLQQNKQYNVIRCYHNPPKSNPSKKAITKKGHYLDNILKGDCSPGPAHKSNVISQWAPKNVHQQKQSAKKTYIDWVQLRARKENFPSSNTYISKDPWQNKSQSSKFSSQKLNFITTQEYDSIKTPGPGAYQVSIPIAKQKKSGKLATNKPIQPKSQIKANLNSYTPISMEYGTFDAIAKQNQLPKTNLSKSATQLGLKKSTSKSTLIVPGPGHYQMINTWKGKSPMKKGELSYMDKVCKKTESNIYHCRA